MQHAKTFSTVESMVGSWFNLEKYIALYKYEQNKPKVWIQTLQFFVSTILLHRLVVKGKLILEKAEEKCNGDQGI